ncbi:MAG: hypothetical protein Rpha_0689 [Candidatus Ruthia sp. Apha_13_S6]|nr:hypothetical protein [Candidatus Ruthia sp. Apha_13_S6]
MEFHHFSANIGKDSNNQYTFEFEYPLSCLSNISSSNNNCLELKNPHISNSGDFEFIDVKLIKNGNKFTIKGRLRIAKINIAVLTGIANSKSFINDKDAKLVFPSFNEN